MIDALIKLIAQWIAWIAERVIEWLWNIVDGIMSWIGQALQQLYDWFAAVLDGLFFYFQTLVEQITSYFNRILDEISSFVAAIWEGFLTLTIEVTDAIRSFIENAWAEVRASIVAVLDSAFDWMRSVSESVIMLIERGIDAVAELAERVKNKLMKWLDEVLKAVLASYNEMVAGFNRALDGFMAPIVGFVDIMASRLSELKIAFADAATSVVAGISETAEDALGPIREVIQELIKNLVPHGNAEPAQAFVRDAQKLAEAGASPQEMRKFAADIWRKTDFKDGFWAELFFTIIGIMGGVALLAQVTQISSQVMMQDFAKQYPFQMFTPGDVTQAWRRGMVSETFALDTIQRHGYTAENAQTVLKLSDIVPTEGDLFVLFHRGLITEENLAKALHQKGYSGDYKKAMTEASFLIPPITDLITMAVREAFTPEVAERFGQYEDYPKEMTPWGEKQALSEEWLRRYWAAHWALPSPQQGFEMLHRGVIDQSDLDLLLRALDVMPFWRDRLIQIAYTPFTRIDIRRMHKIGVLSETDVLRSYKDLGYDEVKSKTMTDFVMKLNAPPDADDEADLKELSRSNVVGFYSDGLIAREKALTLLSTMGYTTDAALLYLDSSDLDEQRKERKEAINLTLALAKAGVISFVEAEDRLRKVGLETYEVSKAIITLVRERERTTKLPSRAESEKMLKLGIIKLEEYKELLSIFGYSEKWVSNFATLAETSV